MHKCLRVGFVVGLSWLLVTGCGDGSVETPTLSKVPLIEAGEESCGNVTVGINEDRNVVSTSLGHNLVAEVGFERFGLSPECLTVYAVSNDLGSGFANLLSMPLDRPVNAPADVGLTTVPLLEIWVGDGDRAEAWELVGQVQAFHSDVPLNANGDREGISYTHSDGAITSIGVFIDSADDGDRTATSMVFQFADRSTPVLQQFGGE